MKSMVQYLIFYLYQCIVIMEAIPSPSLDYDNNQPLQNMYSFKKRISRYKMLYTQFLPIHS